jgi:hypothetical protein
MDARFYIQSIMGATERRRDGWTGAAVMPGVVKVVLMLGGCGRQEKGDGYCREPAMISQSYPDRTLGAEQFCKRLTSGPSSVVRPA